MDRLADYWEAFYLDECPGGASSFQRSLLESYIVARYKACQIADLSSCDINGDGNVDASDLRDMVNASVAGSSSGMTYDATKFVILEFLDACSGSLDCNEVEFVIDSILQAFGDDYVDTDANCLVLNHSGIAWATACCPSSCPVLELPRGGESFPVEGDSDCGGCGGDGAGSLGGAVTEVQITPLPVPGDTCQISNLPNPVHKTLGHKLESVVDLRVMVTGGDFRVSRSYVSDPGYDAPPLLGENWTLSCFDYIEMEDPNVDNEVFPYQGGSAGGHRQLYPSDNPDGFEGNSAPADQPLPGSTSQVFGPRSLSLGGVTYHTWCIEEPGRWQRHYHREFLFLGESAGASIDDAIVGHLFYERDVYGNSRFYDYDVFAQTGSATVARLRSVWLNGIPADGTSQCEAIVRFEWHFAGDAAEFGRLRWIHVDRPDAFGYLIRTQSVGYTYMVEADTSMHADLGTDGDLVQVLYRERVDVGPDSTADDAWYERVRQYRYHGGGGSTGAGGYSWSGSDHQLKMVMEPEQVEWAAREENAGNPAKSVTDYSEILLGLADGADLFSGSADQVVAIAAKVIEAYEPYGGSNLGRVQTQYLQSSCGCGGSSTQGLQLAYTYYAYDSGTDQYWTTRVIESTQGTTSWEYFRTHYYDSQSFGGQDLPYLVQKAIHVDTNDNSTVDTGERAWVVHYKYETAVGLPANSVAWYHPSVMSSYTPAPVAADNAAEYAAHNDQGLVRHFGHSAENRVTEVAVAEGAMGTEYLIERTTYPTGMGVRAHLPTKIERFRTAESPPTTTEADIETTKFTYGFHLDDAIAWVKVEVEAELESELGPVGTNNWYASYQFVDPRGNVAWTRAADGALTQQVYDTASSGSGSGTGALLEVVRNTDHTNVPTWATSSGVTFSDHRWTAESGDLTTQFSVDLMGRNREMISPAGVRSYTMRELRESEEWDGILLLAAVSLPHEFDCDPMGVCSYDGPATISWLNAGGKVVGSRQYPINGGYTMRTEAAGEFNLFDDYGLDTTNLLARSHTIRGISGLVDEVRVWADASRATPDTSKGDSVTVYSYDVLGRVSTVQNSNQTLYSTEYDELHRATESYVGVGGGAPLAAVLVSQTEYDGGLAGDGLMTKQTDHVDGSLTRETSYLYDFRHRLVAVNQPVAPHINRQYDNLDRVLVDGVFTAITTSVATERFAAPVPERVKVERTKYSQRGLVYDSRILFDPAGGSASTSDAGVAQKQWYDEVGRAVASHAPNSPFQKTTYDGAGRVVSTFQTDGRAGTTYGTHIYNATTHEAVVTGDVVTQEVQYRYTDLADLLDLVRTYHRAHGVAETETGALSAMTGADVAQRIVTYAGIAYDGAARPIQSIDYGTNDTTGFVASAVVDPTSTDDALVARTAYDERGFAYSRTSPMGQETRTFYDDMGRVLGVAENWVNGAIGYVSEDVVWLGQGPEDADRLTVYEYDGNGNTVLMHAVDGANEQTTKYVYQAPSTSAYPSNDVVWEVRYPSETTGKPSNAATDTVVYDYNRLGELIKATDENGTVHEYTIDSLGRVVTDKVTAFGSDIDETIDAIQTMYDDAGRVSQVISRKATSDLNGVLFTYNGLWQVIDVHQSHDGVATASDPAVTMTHADSSGDAKNYQRPTNMEYPDGSDLAISYGSNDSLNDRISRVVSLASGTGHSIDVDYEYLGAGIFAEVAYSNKATGVLLDRSVDAGGARIAGKYPGFDQYGRLARQVWVDATFTTGAGVYPNIPEIVAIGYGYDADSNRTKMRDLREGASRPHRDFDYEYDGLDRLERATRGTAASMTAAVSPAADPASGQYLTSQAWALDVLGNWDEHAIDRDGDGAYVTDAGDDVETRTHNYVNELSQRTLGLSDIDLAYDDAGNLRTRELTPITSAVYTHDAWNRLIKVEFGSDDKVLNAYNGLHWRVEHWADSSGNDGVYDEHHEMFYTAAWQLVEDRVDDAAGTPTDVEVRQYVWGIRYIDDIVAQRVDTDVDGTYEQFYYHLTDAQFSTVAVLDKKASLVERVAYDPYGQARHQYAEDVDGDGDVDSADQAIISSQLGGGAVSIGDAGYDVDGDIDRDGDLDFTDYLETLTTKTALAMGQLSGDPGNMIGWTGHVHSGTTLEYTCRHRHYSTALGRWLERDPAGFGDGPNVYRALDGSPIGAVDAFGLLHDHPGGGGGAVSPLTPAQLSACSESCRDAFLPDDPDSYMACYVGCQSGMSGRNCDDYCSAFVDPYQRAVCVEGCKAGMGQQAGGCRVECDGDRAFMSPELAAVCLVVAAGDGPLPFGDAAAGVAAVCCGVAWVAHELTAPKPRAIPMIRRAAPKKKQCMCNKRDGRKEEHGLYFPKGITSERDCKRLPLLKPDVYSSCWWG